MIYIVDIDGTVCNIDHRLHFLKSNPQDWDGFYKACVDDTPITEVITVVKATANAGPMLAFITGRSEIVREETRTWLTKNGLFPIALLMRKEGDHREDNVVKEELLDKLIETFPYHNIGGAFEDRQQVVDMYRRRGLRVFQVAKGNF